MESSDPYLSVSERDDIAGILILMKRGSSIKLTWCQDGLWECSWVIDNARYSEVSPNLHTAVQETLRKATRL